MLKATSTKDKSAVGHKLLYLIAAILILASLVTTFFGKKGFLDIQKQKKRYSELEAQIKEYDQKIEKLKAEIKDLQTNPLSLEKEARERLWLIKPEEKMIVRKKTETSGQPAAGH
ncbi:MAG TPA: septum formation initiator family protein, partial [Candidatus Saccharicenans sp.]|nr:septum formation initiator family protein [Candidatus Saccharicenans sp.]HNT01443.1 septum formation initiator family protein [Candidatus Saccharicenans sp.]